jgi:hypothetical protein
MQVTLGSSAGANLCHNHDKKFKKCTGNFRKVGDKEQKV